MSNTEFIVVPEETRSHRRRVVRASAARSRLEQADSPRFDIPHDGEGFLSTRLREQAAIEQVTVDEMVRHALAYYFADYDEGRVAARAIRVHIPEGTR